MFKAAGSLETLPKYPFEILGITHPKEQIQNKMCRTDELYLHEMMFKA